jgi:hypothetical protein
MPAFAHEEGEAGEEGLVIEFTPALVSAGQETVFVADIFNATSGEQVTDAAVEFVFDFHDAGISDRVSAAEREPGHYWVSYAPSQAGSEWEVHIEFSMNGEEIRQTVPFTVTGKSGKISGTSMLLILGGILFLAGLAVYFLSPKAKGKKKYGLLATIIITAGILVVLGSSLFAFFQVGAQEGIVICNEETGECFFQAHIHSFIVPMVCGEEQRFETEVGPLSATHTHEEKNTLHWHDVLPYDNENKRILDETNLMLGNSLDNLDVRLTDECFYEYCNGDLCLDGTAGTLKAYANKENYFETGREWQKLDNPTEYVWSDRDLIYIAFDNRTNEEVLAFLNQERIRFPILGVG